MNTEQLEKLRRPEFQKFLAQPHLARLGTSNPRTNQPHVVPVWYEWDGESIYISAFVSTRKVRDIYRNRRISVLVDIAEKDGATMAVLFEGAAEIIENPALVQKWATSIYTRYLGPEGVLAEDPQSWIVDPENRIIKLTPEAVYTWGGG